MKKVKILGLFIVIGAVLNSCRYDRADELYVTPVCDTTVTTFALCVEPILQQHCYSCHNNATYVAEGGGILLEGYVNMIDYVNIGTFMSSIKHESSNPMPKNAAKLDDCSIKRLEIWVANGAQDN